MTDVKRQSSIGLTFFSKLVIYASLLWIGQDLVSLCDLFEPVLGVGIAVLVRVELESHLPVGLPDLIFIGVRGDAQDFVEIFACWFYGKAGSVLLRPGAFLWIKRTVTLETKPKKKLIKSLTKKKKNQSIVQSFTYRCIMHIGNRQRFYQKASQKCKFLLQH